MAPNGIQHRGGEGLRPSTASCSRLRAQLANNHPNIPRIVPFLPKLEHNAQLTAGETEARPAQAICSMPGRGVQIQGSCPALCRLQPARASCSQQQSQKQPLFCREESTEASPKAKLFGDSSPARGDASGGSTAVREGCSDLKPLTKLSHGRHAPSLCCELAFGCLISACPASCSGLPKKKEWRHFHKEHFPAPNPYRTSDKFTAHGGFSARSFPAGAELPQRARFSPGALFCRNILLSLANEDMSASLARRRAETLLTCWGRRAQRKAHKLCLLRGRAVEPKFCCPLAEFWFAQARAVPK